MPTISVVVPVYKVEKYIKRCVDSILAQTFGEFDLILVDDGSPDNCGAICDQYARQDARVVVIHQENGGLSAARNAGIDWAFANSHSRWLTFIDSDDWVHPEMLERLLSAARTHDVSVSICGYAETTGEAPAVTHAEAALWTPEDLFVRHNVNATVAWGKLYRKECFQTIRYPVGRLHEDVFTTHQILFPLEQVAVLPSPLYCYYVNQEGITNAPWTPKRLESLEARRQQIAFFQEHGFHHAHRRAVTALLYDLERQITQQSRAEAQDQRSGKRLRRLLRTALRRYRALLALSPGKDCGLYEAAYPRLMKFYWYVRAALRKLRLER